VYRHIRLDKNQPFYIGIGSDKNYKRANSFKNRNKYWNEIVNSTGYEVEILLDNLTFKDACIKEKEFIKIYGREDLQNGILCNLTSGGQGKLDHNFSEETRTKMSKAQLGNQKYKLRVTSQEEVNKKISIANKGRKRSESFKKKLSERNSGYGNPNYKVKMSEEQKEKLRKANKCFIVHQFDLQGNFIKEWDSTRSVKYGGFTQANVWRCCNRISKTHKKYIWKYK
jgi:hypothetical protein